MRSWRVGHDWATSLSLFTFMLSRKKWQPTPVFLPGESQGRGSLVGCRPLGRMSRTWLKWLSSSSSSSRTAACQASLSSSRNLPKFMSIESVMPSNHLIPFSSCPQSFPASGSFQMSQLFASGGQSIGVSASTSVLPMNTQDWSPLDWTGWISLQSKGLSSLLQHHS